MCPCDGQETSPGVPTEDLSTFLYPLCGFWTWTPMTFKVEAVEAGLAVYLTEDLSSDHDLHLVLDKRHKIKKKNTALLKDNVV